MTQTPPDVDSPRVGDDGYRDALGFLYDRINYERLVGTRSGYRFRLQRITELLRQLELRDYLYADSPVPKVPLVHIAGTMVMGSVASMVAAMLTASGRRTGLYTSPHVHALEERFRVDGEPCSPQELVALVQQIRPQAEGMEKSLGSPSFFELTTAIALAHFDSQRCDAIVMEVGLGGRLDSTNVCAPTVSAITSIGLDHQHVLGDSLPAIAGEKAGILKKGIPVVSGVRDEGAAEVIAAMAGKIEAPLHKIDRDFQFDFAPTADWGSKIEYRGLTPPLRPKIEASLSMEGEHQGSNAAVAIAITDLLTAAGTDVSVDAVTGGLGPLQCNSRIERFRLPDDVTAIVDAAHNEDSIAALCECLKRRCTGRRVAVVFGTSVDKEAAPMLSALSEIADRFVLTRFFGNPRFQPPEELAPVVPEPIEGRTEVVEDPIVACRRGLESVTPGGVLVVCGSFFLAAETRHWIADHSLTLGLGQH